MKREKSDYTIKSVVKAFRILESFKKQAEWGITELANHLNINKSTLFHLLATLSSLGYIKQNKAGKYSLDVKVIELSSILLNRMELVKEARALLERLVEVVNETVNLVTLIESDVMYIEKIETTEAIRINSQVGSRLGSYCTGVGKAILAFLSEKRLEEVLKNIKFEQHTVNTITTPKDLKRELQITRMRGYAIDDEEIFAGIKCVAAPILNHNGEVIASVSVAGPKARMEQKGERRIASHVTATAAEISRRLGWNSGMDDQ